MAGKEETNPILWEKIMEEQKRQTTHAGRNERTFGVRDKVWLSTRNFKTSRPWKQLNYKCTRLCMVRKIINQNPYKLDLLSTFRNHNVFPALHLDHYTPPVGGQPSSEPDPVIVEKIQKWEVHHILDSWRCYWNLQYVIQWASYNHIRMSWEPAEDLEHAQDLVDNFPQDVPNLPWK